MAKKEVKMENETQTPVNKDDALTRYDDTDSRLSLSQVVQALAIPGINLDEWKPSVTGGADYYWPAEPGQVLHGILLSRDERPTNLIVEGRQAIAAFYTVQLLSPAKGIDGEGQEVALEPGKLISVLERTMLRGMAKDVEQEVVIACDAKGKTKRGLDLWRYRTWVRKPVSQTGSGMTRDVQVINTTGA